MVENDYQQNLFSVVRLFKDVMPLGMMFNQCQECAARSRRVNVITTAPEVNEVRPSTFDYINPFRFYFEQAEHSKLKVFDPEIERNCNNFVDQSRENIFKRRAAAFTFRTPNPCSYLYDTEKLMQRMSMESCISQQ